ncbi:MAG TPA: hypothetical protein VHJ55_11625, partial [Casimicrobiaceae bacterium]|nr:hypothetical protein [Casimicrobiaceae bacterium]
LSVGGGGNGQRHSASCKHLNSTHDCFLLDGRIARFLLMSRITGHFAKEAIGVVPADDAHEGVDVAGRFGAKVHLRWP